MIQVGMVLKETGGFRFWMRGFPRGQRGGAQDPIAKAFEGSNPSPRTFYRFFSPPPGNILSRKLLNPN